MEFSKFELKVIKSLVDISSLDDIYKNINDLPKIDTEVFLQAEINTIENLLSEIPDDDLFTRVGLEDRLEEARDLLDEAIKSERKSVQVSKKQIDNALWRIRKKFKENE